MLTDTIQSRGLAFAPRTAWVLVAGLWPAFACGGPEFQAERATAEGGMPAMSIAGSGGSAGRGGAAATAGFGGSAESGGTSAGGKMNGSGGEGGMATGGTISGDAGLSGSSGTDAGGGTSGGVGSSCASPYLRELEAAVDLALADTFMWQDVITNQFTGTCYAGTWCTNTPCGTCAVTWHTPEALPDGSKVYVDFDATCDRIPASAACGSEAWGCYITMVGSGTVTLSIAGQPQLDNGSLYWPAPDGTVLGQWKSTDTNCGYLVEATASDDLNAELNAALPSAAMTATCP